MPGKRKRSIKWSPVLWTLFLMNTTLGLCFSRATSAVKVQVIGARDGDQSRIRKELVAMLKGTPAMRVLRNLLEEKLCFPTFVRSCRLQQNVFGRANLQMEYREPVARLSSMDSVYLSTDGVFFAQVGIDKVLPILDLGLLPDCPNLGAVSRFETEDFAKASRSIAIVGGFEECIVRSSGSEGLSVTAKEYGEVVLGSAGELEQKIAKLKEIIADPHREIGPKSKLNLVSPTHPAISTGTTH